LDQILSERDACGVGLIASLKQEATHNIVEQVWAHCERLPQQLLRVLQRGARLSNAIWKNWKEHTVDVKNKVMA